MNNIILCNVNDKSNYMLLIRAANGADIDSDGISKLITIYEEVLAKHDIHDTSIIKYTMYLDIPKLRDRFISDDEKIYLDNLLSMYKNAKYENFAISIQDILSNDSISESLKITLARAILDRLSTLNINIAIYNDGIDKLIEFLSGVDEDMFNQVSIFLGFIRSKY